MLKGREDSRETFLWLLMLLYVQQQSLHWDKAVLSVVPTAVCACRSVGVEDGTVLGWGQWPSPPQGLWHPGAVTSQCGGEEGAGAYCP